MKCEPDEAVLAMNTDYYIEGSPLKRFEKAALSMSFTLSNEVKSMKVNENQRKTMQNNANQVQFICLWDFERTRTEQDSL